MQVNGGEFCTFGFLYSAARLQDRATYKKPNVRKMNDITPVEQPYALHCAHLLLGGAAPYLSPCAHVG